MDPTTGLRGVSIANVPSAWSHNGGNELRMMTVRERVFGGSDLQTFRNTINGHVLTLPGNISDDITSLNAIISKAASIPKPNNTYEIFPIGANKFFIKRTFRELGGNNGILQSHTGFFSTIKPAMAQMVLNLNIATSAFYRPIFVSEYLRRVAGTEIAHRDQQGLRGVRVYIDYERGTMPINGNPLASLPINQPNARVRTIGSIGPATVNATTFGAANISIVTYLNAGEFIALFQDEESFPLIILQLIQGEQDSRSHKADYVPLILGRLLHPSGSVPNT